MQKCLKQLKFEKFMLQTKFGKLNNCKFDTMLQKIFQPTNPTYDR